MFVFFVIYYMYILKKKKVHIVFFGVKNKLLTQYFNIINLLSAIILKYNRCQWSI